MQTAAHNHRRNQSNYNLEIGFSLINKKWQSQVDNLTIAEILMMTKERRCIRGLHKSMKKEKEQKQQRCVAQNKCNPNSKLHCRKKKNSSYSTRNQGSKWRKMTCTRKLPLSQCWHTTAIKKGRFGNPPRNWAIYVYVSTYQQEFSEADVCHLKLYIVSLSVTCTQIPQPSNAWQKLIKGDGEMRLRYGWQQEPV